MANKYDITSGLGEYRSMYHDVGVDKYIDAVKSLRETHDKNLAGINLVNEGVQQMEFMPGDDQMGRAYLTEGVNGILQGAMDAPEEATMQVNRAAQFFTSDPTASAYRRNAKEWSLTKELALNTPGGWSSMIMFGDDPFNFQTINPEDGSVNQYVHRAEGRLNQEGKFLDMVGTIAKDTSVFGPEFQDITGDQIADILVSGSSTGISNSKADRIADGVMEQFLQTAEGRQAMRELLEPVGGQPPVTDDREEAKSILLNRFRPLIQNQVGFSRNISASQISGSNTTPTQTDIFGSHPSMLLEMLKGDVTNLGVETLESLGLETGSVITTDRILNSYANVVDYGYIRDIPSDYQISPGFKPFENLDNEQKSDVTIKLMQVISLAQEGRHEEAIKLSAEIPGYVDAMAKHPKALQAGLTTFYNYIGKENLEATQESLGVLMNLNIGGGIIVNDVSGAETKTINRGGQTYTAIKTRVFLTDNQLNIMSEQDPNISTIGTGKDWGTTDINYITNPRDGRNIFEKGEYDGKAGYFLDVWVEKPVDLGLQEAVDRNRPNMGAGEIEENDPMYKQQVKLFGELTGMFQRYKAEYTQNGTMFYNAGHEFVDGQRIPKIDKINLRPYVKPGSAIDLKIKHIFDLLPQAAISSQISQGSSPIEISNLVTTQVRLIVSTKQDEATKAKKLQELIEGLKALTN